MSSIKIRYVQFKEIKNKPYYYCFANIIFYLYTFFNQNL